jgi:hypothetical protein
MPLGLVNTLGREIKSGSTASSSTTRTLSPGVNLRRATLHIRRTHSIAFLAGLTRPKWERSV